MKSLMKRIPKKAWSFAEVIKSDDDDIINSCFWNELSKGVCVDDLYIIDSKKAKGMNILDMKYELE